jgi:membrane-associated protease RseP (regulator of RpoE activity)
MSTVAKNLAKTFGGAAAAVLSVAGLAGGQGAVVAPTRRDSTVTQRVILLPGRMDSIGVMAARIVQERAGSAAWVTLTAQFDSLIVASVNKRFVMRGGIVAPPALMFRSMPVAKGWLGFNAQGPSLIISDSSGTRFRFFAYQPIISVDPGSPADRAGIAPGDLLVAYNGVDLINHEFNFDELFAPKKHVDVSVRRDGEVKTFSLTVAMAPEDVSRRRMEMDKVFRIEVAPGGGARIFADGDGASGFGGAEHPVGAPARVATGVPLRAALGASPGAFGTIGSMPLQKMVFFSANGLFGASLSNVSEELARALKIRKGVLVNEVPEDTPAFRAGLRSGDVIVTADDDSVTTVNALRDAVSRHLPDRSVDLEVVRQQKLKKVTVSWPESP